jgi:hypothetical protein
MKIDEPEGELITQEMLGVAMVTTTAYEDMIDKYSLMLDQMEREDMSLSALAIDYEKMIQSSSRIC